MLDEDEAEFVRNCISDCACQGFIDYDSVVVRVARKLGMPPEDFWGYKEDFLEAVELFDNEMEVDV